jgi:putative endonuclease
MHHILTKSSQRLLGEARVGQATAVTSTERGKSAEDKALAYLLEQGLVLRTRNYKTPGRGGGEIDLVMQEADGTVVFVEVRQRRSKAYGGAAASVGHTKQRRLVLAAHRYLVRCRQPPACRFDVVTLEPQIQWIKAAFDAASFYRG